MNKKSLIGKFGAVALSATMLAGGILPTVSHAETSKLNVKVDSQVNFTSESILNKNILKKQINVDSLEEVKIENEISLDVAVPQEVTYTDNQGRTVTVGAVPETTEAVGRQTQTVTNGTWKIYYYLGIINMAYKINISNKKITSAYSPTISMIGSITSESLTYSSTKATYRVMGDIQGWFSASATLEAKISGNNLITSFY